MRRIFGGLAEVLKFGERSFVLRSQIVVKSVAYGFEFQLEVTLHALIRLLNNNIEETECFGKKGLNNPSGCMDLGPRISLSSANDSF